jgi:hypothetical protein
MDAPLPKILYALDGERLAVRARDWLDDSVRDALAYFLEYEVAPLGEEPERFPAPVRPELLIASNESRAFATITCQGWRLAVSTLEALDDDHPMRGLDTSPLQPATAPAAIEAALRWWLGCGRLPSWRLGTLLMERDGVDALAVTTSGRAEIEAVARREGCEGIVLLRGRAVAWEEAATADALDEPAVEVVPCKGGLPGRAVGLLWKRRMDR